jgi:hypothetical protein
MPNWTCNALEFDTRFTESLRLDDGHLDFNRWIPMPDSLRQTSGGLQEEAVSYIKTGVLSERAKLEIERVRGYVDAHHDQFYLDYYGLYLKDRDSFYPITTLHKDGNDYAVYTKEMFADLGAIYVTNELKYGYQDWYDWSIENWGMKWNASDSQLVDYGNGRSLLVFSTPWCQPKADLMRMIVSGLGDDWTFEASYEDGPLVCDIDGREKDPDTWELFRLAYMDGDGEEISREEYLCIKDSEDEWAYVDTVLV